MKWIIRKVKNVVTWFNPSVVDWMEADLKASWERKGRGLNNGFTARSDILMKIYETNVKNIRYHTCIDEMFTIENILVEFHFIPT